MGSLSAGDLILLRDRQGAQYSQERLYGFGYPEMWRGQVNDATIARGDQTIATDTGVMQGTFVFANLVADLLLFVGSSAGADDKGRRRILSISGVAATPTIIVDWNDDINWLDDDHLTIVHFFPPWPRFSWFTGVGPIFTKDGPNAAAGGAGEVYVDQNEDAVPLVIMGPHYAGELSGGTLAVQLSAINSQAVADGATITAFAWAAVPTAGASFDNSAIAAPIVTFTTDNSKYQISCTVTDSNANTSIGYRTYQIGGAITEFSRSPITETYDNPSVNTSITLTSPETTDSAAIRPVMTWSDFADRTLVVITSEDQYGSTQKAISFRDAAQYEDHLHILYVGYLWAENDDLVDDGSGTVTLNAVSTIPMFLYSISLTGVETPTDWYEMDKTLMTVAANLFHLFKYQSTLLEIMDWHLPWSDTVKRSANEEFNEGSLVDRAMALAGSRLMAITAVGLGEVWVETDLNLRDSTDRAAETTTLTMTDSDVSGTKRARVRQYGDVIRSLVDGGSSTGLLGSFTPFLSASQFIARAEGRPQMVNFSRLMLPDQTESNRLAGRIATVANGKFQEVNLELTGNYRGVFSPGDQQKIDLGDTFAGALQANIRGYTDLEDADVIVRTMTHTHANGFTSVSIVADVMQAEGLTGVTITPPIVPPDAIEPGSGDTPSFEPPLPPVFPPVPPDMAVAGAIVALDATSGVFFSLDSGTSWEQRNGGFSAANGFDLIWSPWWKTAFENNTNNPEDVVFWWTGTSYIRKSEDSGKTWADHTQYLDDPDNVGSDSPAPTKDDLTYIQIRGDIHNFGTYYVLARWQNGASAWRSWVYKTTDNGFTWASADIHAIASSSFLMRHEANNLNEYDSTTAASGGIVGTSAASAMDSTNFGLFSTVTGSLSQAFAIGNFPAWGGTQATVNFWFDPNSITMPSVNPINWAPPNPDVVIFRLTTSGGTSRIFVEIQNNLGTFVVRLAVRDDGGVLRTTSDPITLVDNPQKITIEANKATTAVANDGSLVLKIDDAIQDTISSVDFFNSYADIAQVRVGITDVNEVGISGTVYLDEVSGGVTAGGTVAAQAYGMSLTTDQQGGNKLYITSWKDGDIYTEKYTTELVQATSTILGASTIGQVTGLTFFAALHPSPNFTAAGFGDTVWAFGRWDDGTVKHLSVSTDSGLTWTDTGDGAWTTQRIGAFFTTSASVWYALLNAATAELQESTDTGGTWANISTPPFSAEFEALSVHPDGRLQIGNRIAAAQMGAYLDTDYSVSSWVNNTGSPSLPTGGGGIKSIIWIP